MREWRVSTDAGVKRTMRNQKLVRGLNKWRAQASKGYCLLKTKDPA